MNRIICSLLPSLSLYCVIAFTMAEVNPLKFYEEIRFWLSTGGISGFFAVYFSPHWKC